MNYVDWLAGGFAITAPLCCFVLGFATKLPARPRLVFRTLFIALLITPTVVVVGDHDIHLIPLPSIVFLIVGWGRDWKSLLFFAIPVTVVWVVMYLASMVVLKPRHKKSLTQIRTLSPCE
jgi:hypothetical protein